MRTLKEVVDEILFMVKNREDFIAMYSMKIQGMREYRLLKESLLNELDIYLPRGEYSRFSIARFNGGTVTRERDGSYEIEFAGITTPIRR